MDKPRQPQARKNFILQVKPEGQQHKEHAVNIQHIDAGYEKIKVLQRQQKRSY
jgi:hypothetical protein